MSETAKLEVILLADGQEIRRTNDERAWAAVMDWIIKHREDKTETSEK